MSRRLPLGNDKCYSSRLTSQLRELLPDMNTSASRAKATTLKPRQSNVPPSQPARVKMATSDSTGQNKLPPKSYPAQQRKNVKKDPDLLPLKPSSTKMKSKALPKFPKDEKKVRDNPSF